MARGALTRSERARKVRATQTFDRYEETARRVLDALLARYSDQGIEALERAVDARQMAEVLQVTPFSELGRPLELIDAFGDRQGYIDAVRQLQRQIYDVA